MAQRGFTLIEVAIGLAIIVILAGIAIPTMDSITRAELRTSASKTAGMVKATYDMSVLAGRTCRLTFDFEKRTMTPEISTDYVGLSLNEDRSERERRERREREQREKDKEKAEDNKGAGDDDLEALLAIAKRQIDRTSGAGRSPRFSAAPGTTPYELPGGVRFSDVSAEHLRDAVKDGKVEIYFFPMGFAEHALIHLQDEAGRVFAVEIEPLTGRTKIFDQRKDFKEES
jgi:prepilin-type N-terminal cleavage/methylation domain-containing protein